MAVRHKIPNTRRVEVIINGIAVRTTAGQIREGLGRFMSVNNSARGALEFLEKSAKEDPKTNFRGIMGDFGVHQVQLDLL
jgi:hypothetical protein